MQVLSLSGSLPAAPGSAPWKARLAAEPPKNCVRESGESRERGPTLSPGAGSSALRWPAVTQAERSGAVPGLASLQVFAAAPSNSHYSGIVAAGHSGAFGNGLL